MTTETKTQSQHAGEAAVLNQARRDESKAPADKYVFPKEVQDHVDAIRKYCEEHKPEVNVLIALGHRRRVNERDDAIEMSLSRSGEASVLIHLHNQMGDMLAKSMVREILRTFAGDNDD